MNTLRTDPPTTSLDSPTGSSVHRSLEYALLEAHAWSEDADARREALARAEAIVFRLGAELDGRQGGELARRLTALYGFMRDELRALRGTADGDRMEALLELAVTLRVAAEVGRAA